MYLKKYLLCTSALLVIASCSNSVEEVSKEQSNKPIFSNPTSDSIDIDENTLNVSVISAYDQDQTSAVAIRISGGEDSQFFDLSGSSLTFKQDYTPDYENPNDVNGDNSYIVNITATDRTGLEATLPISVNIVNVNDNPPKFVTEQALTLMENSTVVTNISVVDADDEVPEILLTGGVDLTKFKLNGTELVFETAPDYETPLNSGMQVPNIYRVEITVKDAENLHTISKEFSVEVINMPPEKPKMSIGSGINKLTFSWGLDSNNEAFFYQLIESPDGVAKSVVKDNISSSQLTEDLTIAVHSVNWTNAYYLLNACDNTECVPSDPVYIENNMLTTIGYLKGSNATQGSHFGKSTALSADGNTFAVANEYEVYIYTRQSVNDKWVETILSQSFNWISPLALSDDGNTLAVGDADDNTAVAGVDGDQVDGCLENPVSNCEDDSGAVYIYKRDNNNQWSQDAYIKSNFPYALTFFGNALDLSGNGNVLAVGTNWEGSASIGIDGDPIYDCSAITPINCVAGSGAAYIYKRDQGTNKWSGPTYFKPDWSNGGNFRFGVSVALDYNGNMLVVAAKNEGPLSNQRTGATYIFQDMGGVWEQTYKFSMGGTSVGVNNAGDSIVISNGGNVSTELNVALYVKDPNFTSSWKNTKTFISLVNGYIAFGGLGASVSISPDGSAIIVGVVGDHSKSIGVGGNPVHDCGAIVETNCAYESGSVYYYKRNSNNIWSSPVIIKAPNAEAGDLFSGSIYYGGIASTKDHHSRISTNLDGSLLVIGAPNEDGDGQDISAGGVNQLDNSLIDSGAVYLY